MDTGYVKLFRKIGSHWLWKDKPFSKGQAWLDLIKDAHHSEKPFEFLIDFTTIKIKLERGQLFTSVDKLGHKWGWSAKKVRSFLQLLEQEQMIVKKGITKGTTITIARYADYADWGKQEIEQTANSGQTKGDKQECKKNGKNEEKGKKEKNPVPDSLEITEDILKYAKEISFTEDLSEFIKMFLTKCREKKKYRYVNYYDGLKSWMKIKADEPKRLTKDFALTDNQYKHAKKLGLSEYETDEFTQNNFIPKMISSGKKSCNWYAEWVLQLNYALERI